jgi:hypothetical protein
MEIKTEFTLGNLEYSKVLPDKYSWNELKECGFSFSDGWKVPFRDELSKLFDNLEDSRDGAYLWSASATVDDSDYAWIVNFGHGYAYYYYLRTFSFGVRLVRDTKND